MTGVRHINTRYRFTHSDARPTHPMETDSRPTLLDVHSSKFLPGENAVDKYCVYFLFGLVVYHLLREERKELALKSGTCVVASFFFFSLARCGLVCAFLAFYLVHVTMLFFFPFIFFFFSFLFVDGNL